MDLGVALVGALVIVACLLPFIIMYKTKKYKEEQLLEELKNTASEKGFLLTNYEVSGDLAVGIDENSNVFGFCKNVRENKSQEFIRLNDVKKCSLINLKNSNGSQSIIDKLALSFEFKTKTNPSISVVFYNSEQQLQLSKELQLIEKWYAIINQKIKA